MIDLFATLSPVMQALLATLFTWGMTALGAALVFATKTVNQKLMDGMLGFAGGVMIAASFWSLLSPSIEMEAADGIFPSWLPAAAGFILGGLLLGLADKIITNLNPSSAMKDAEGISPARRTRSTLQAVA